VTDLPTNDSAAAKQKFDDEIRELFSVLRKSESALPTIGLRVAQACMAGLYSADPLLAAAEAYELRGVKAATGEVQKSKLAAFPTVARLWEGRGLKLVEAVVSRTEGEPRQYTLILKVLAALRKKRKGPSPSVKEIPAMIAEAQGVKSGDQQNPRTKVAEVIETLVNEEGTSDEVRAAWTLLKDFLAGKKSARRLLPE
jgi:hypothetical protein